MRTQLIAGLAVGWLVSASGCGLSPIAEGTPDGGSGSSGAGTSGGTSSGSAGSSTGSNGSSSSGSSGSASGSSSSSGSGGSQSGSTGDGGSSGFPGTCSSHQPDTELVPCTTSDDCGCPLLCTIDPALSGGRCEYPCQGLADCPSVDTTCVNGSCALDVCTNEDGFCTIQLPQDGTCLPQVVAGVPLDLCIEGGDQQQGQACFAGGSRSGLLVSCAAGMWCTPNDGCQAPCDPTLASSGCPNGSECSAPLSSNPKLGWCEG